MPANNVKLKHTAAPWELKMLTGMVPQAIVKKPPRGIDQFICLFVRSGGISNEEALANAVLIEKAPDLLRVLDDVNNALYRVGQDPAGVMRVNEHDICQLRFLLRELGGEHS